MCLYFLPNYKTTRRRIFSPSSSKYRHMSVAFYVDSYLFFNTPLHWRDKSTAGICFTLASKTIYFSRVLLLEPAQREHHVEFSHRRRAMIQAAGSTSPFDGSNIISVAVNSDPLYLLLRFSFCFKWTFWNLKLLFLHFVN
jgi:hypothetical protein